MAKVGLMQLRRLARLASRPESVFAILSIAVLSISYGGPYVVHFVDVTYPYHVGSLLQGYLFAWSNVNEGSYSAINIYSFPSFAIYWGLAATGLPPWAVQFSVDAFALWSAGFGMYAFLTYFLGRSRSGSLDLGVLLASVFYSFSIVTVEIFFWDFVPTGLLAFALLPTQALLLLLVCDKVTRPFKEVLPYVGVFALLSVFTIGANEPADISVVFVLLALCAFKVLTAGRLSRLRTTGIVGLLFLATLAINSYWLLPELQLGTSSVGGPPSGLPVGTNLYDFLSYSSRLNILWGLELRGIQSGNLAWYGALYNTSGAFSLIFLPLVLLILLPIYLIKSDPSRVSRIRTLSLGVMLLAATLLYAGANAPLYSQGLSWFFLNPDVLQLFRNTGNAIGLGIVFIEAALLAVSFERLRQRASRSRLVVAPSDIDPLQTSGSPRVRFRLDRASDPRVIATLIVVSAMVPYVAASFSGGLVPPAPYQSKSLVPAYVDDLASFVDSHSDGQYTLLVPGGFQEQNWSAYGGHGYDGYDVLAQEISTPVIYDTGGGFAGVPNQLVQAAYYDLESNSTGSGYATLLSTLHVRLVVVETGLGEFYPFGDQLSVNATQAIAFLSNQTDISWLATFGPDQVFENLQIIPSMVIVPSTIGNSSFFSTNITGLYENASGVELSGETASPISLLKSTSQTFTLETTGQDILSGYPFPGFPVLYNGLPLNISLSSFPDLGITFTTSEFAALSFGVAGSGFITEENFSSAWASTWQYSSSSGNALPNPGWYYTDGSTMTVIINVEQAVLAAAGLNAALAPRALNYIYFNLGLTDGRGNEIQHVNQTNVHNVSVTILSLNALAPFYWGPSRSISPTSSRISTFNITSAFVESFSRNSTSSIQPPVFPSISSGGLDFQVSAKQLLVGFQFPAFPVGFNTLPLEKSFSTDSYLVITFRTSEFADVSFGVSDAASINQSDFQSVWSGATRDTQPSSNTEPSPGWYSSGSGQLTIAINVPPLLDKPGASQNVTSGSVLNYIYVNLGLTDGHGQQIAGVNASNAQNLSVVVTSVYQTSAFQYAAGEVSLVQNSELTNWTVLPNAHAAFDPMSDAVDSASYSGLSRVGNVESTEVSPSEWMVTVQNASSEFMVVFFQDWNPGWEAISDSGGVLAIVHVEADDFANGWILTLQGNMKSVSLDLIFSPQDELNTGIEISGAVALILTISTIWFSHERISKRFRPRDS